MKKSVIILFLFACAFIPKVNAGVYISEIMYDYEGTDTDYEWIELSNDGNSDVSISGWKFNDGSNHNLNTPPTNGSTGSLTVPAGGFLILASNASSLNSLYNLSVSVIDTVMSMNNTAETISILDANSSTIDSVTFSSVDGANGDGKSLQLVSGSWISGTPTPGDENSGSVSGEGDNGDEDIVSTGLSTDDEAELADFEVLPYKTEIIVPDIIMAGDTIDFRAYTTKNDGMVTHSGTFIWNMGDGNFYNLKTDTLEHVFEYPGTYKVNLSYFRKGQSSVAEATDSIVLRVVAPTVEVKNISSDGSVTIFNNSTNVLSLDGWSIVSDGFAFYFPFGSNILGKGEITISKKITKFPYVPNNIEIRSPSGETIDKFPDQITSIISSQSSSRTNNSFLKTEIIEETISSSTIPLTANVLGSKSNNKNNNVLILGILFVIFGIGFYFYEKGISFFNNLFRKDEQKSPPSDDGEDFDLLNPDDFTILQEDPKR